MLHQLPRGQPVPQLLGVLCECSSGTIAVIVVTKEVLIAVTLSVKQAGRLVRMGRVCVSVGMEHEDVKPSCWIDRCLGKARAACDSQQISERHHAIFPFRVRQ